MSTIAFRAHCARQHDRVDFTDPAAFESHMTTEHGKRKPTTRANAKPRPWTAPEAPADTRRLTAVLVKAASGGYDPRFSTQGHLGEWTTPECVPPTGLGSGDTFVIPSAPGVEYFVLDTDPERGWHLEMVGDHSQAGSARRGWLREIKLPGHEPAESVVVVKRAD